MQNEKELKDISNQNRMLAQKFNKQKHNNEILKDMYEKLHETFEKKYTTITKTT